MITHPCSPNAQEEGAGEATGAGWLAAWFWALREMPPPGRGWRRKTCRTADTLWCSDTFTAQVALWVDIQVAESMRNFCPPPWPPHSWVPWTITGEARKDDSCRGSGAYSPQNYSSVLGQWDGSAGKGACCQAWQPEFDPWDPRNGYK